MSDPRRVYRGSKSPTAVSKHQSFEFHQGKKALLSARDEGLNLLRTWCQVWQQLDPAECAGFSEVKLLLQAVQDVLVKILVLDRENQQALLRRGLVPARQARHFTTLSPHYATRICSRQSP